MTIFPPPISAEKRENYASLDGLRAYAAIGIVLMHVRANLDIKPSANVLTEQVIPWFTCFTLLFMMVSAFSMCCGYYERVKNGAITPQKFYSKRYHRTWPFFAMMVCIDFVMKPSWSSFCQSFADLTMCFNLLPNPHIEVIGVGWFLGTIFTFYMLFPFFTFLLDNKKRGWMVFGLSLLFCYIAVTYFGTPDKVVKPIGAVNIIYSAPFFISGGMIYLYRKGIKTFVEKHWLAVLMVCIVLNIAKFTIPLKGGCNQPELIIFSAWLIYAIGTKDVVLNNRVVKYLSGISMEIYLCHMMCFRVASMLHFEKFIHQQDILYVLTCITTLAGAICFSHVVKYYVFPYAKKKYTLLDSHKKLDRDKNQ